MLIEAVAFFLGVSILFYCLFAGADFGAGILEAFAGNQLKLEQKQIISQAISPVWEANHVWLILAVVILFVGFPVSYSLLSITFHIPLTVILIGIILRGCAFTFRHYDAVQDKSQHYYSAIFVFSSFLTPLFLGVVAGGMLLGRIPLAYTNFYQSFVGPWLNLFSFSVGFFTCVLFAFLASIFLIGETENKELKKIFIRRALVCNILAVIGGGLLFLFAAIDGLNLISYFLSDNFSLTCVGIVSLILIPLWFAVLNDYSLLARFLVALLVGFVLLGWYKLQFPNIINLSNNSVTIYNSAAPVSTLRFLFYSLIFGSFCIFPALFYLFKVFKRTS